MLAPGPVRDPPESPLSLSPTPTRVRISLEERLWRAVYDALVLPSAEALLPAAALVDSKAAAYRAARAGWRAALETALAARPDVALGDALWVHAASAGEFLQARALLRALRSVRPDLPLVYTYTSPSALPLLQGFRGADLVFPLPIDSRANVRDWLDAVRPAALALVDAELWPNALLESRRRGLPVALVSARLGGDSRRVRGPLRGFFRGLQAALDLVACADDHSAALFRAGGVEPARVAVTGDLRVDETLRRTAELPPRAGLPLPELLPLVVAGSTWPEDEAVLLRALEVLRDRGVLLALALAPHEVSAARLEGLEASLAARGFTPARWSSLAASEADAAPVSGGRDAAARAAAPVPRSLRVAGALGTGLRQTTDEPAVDALIVDRVGLLYRLYGSGRVAWIGGAFRNAVHNVMEPVAFGIPVVTGPETGRSWIARELTDRCALYPVADVPACAAALEHLLLDGGAAAEAGARGRAVLEVHAGAAARTVVALAAAGWLSQTETAEGSSSR
ncbi:MAG: 3-deoxy-D-manno-octulosonic acid transferase [Gemmatimonadota bacterium]